MKGQRLHTIMQLIHTQKMSNLTLYNKKEISNIPSRDQEIVLALNTPIVSSLSDRDSYDLFKGEIVKAYVLAKFETPIGSELQILADGTMKAFKQKFGSIRIEELAICFNRGLCGEYGNDWKGLSLITFSYWATCYMKEQSRIKLLTPMEEKKEPTLLERFEIAKRLALSTLVAFMNGLSIEMQGATVYRFLAKLKIIQYSEEEQADFMEGAKTMVINNKQREKFTSMDKHIRAAIEKELADVTLLDTKIKHTAQHNGLANYFALIVKDEEQPIAYLTGLINQQAKQYLTR